MIKNAGRLVFSIIVCVMLISGCVQEKKTEEPVEVKQEEVNVLIMTQTAYQNDDVEGWAQLFTGLTGIKVNLSFAKSDEQYEKVIGSAVSATPTYDICAIDMTWTAEYASKNYLLPLDEYAAGFKTDIPQAVWDGFSYDGKIWAIPFLANFQLFFYNTELIKKAKFSGDPPKTLEEMVKMMKVMKTKKVVTYPWTDAWSQGENLLCEYVWLTGAFGGDLYDASGKPAFNDGPGLKALEFMVMLLKEGYASTKCLSNDEIAAKDDFINGNAAFTSNWLFQTAFLDDPAYSKIEGKAAAGILPVSEAIAGKTKTASVSWFQGLAIPANAANRENAQKWLAFCTSPLIQRAYLKAMPVRKSVAENAYAKSMDPLMAVKSEELASVHHRPKAPAYKQVSSILQKYIYTALEMKMDPKDALDEAVKEIDAIQ